MDLNLLPWYSFSTCLIQSFLTFFSLFLHLLHNEHFLFHVFLYSQFMILASLLNFLEVALGLTTCIINLLPSLNYITPLLHSVRLPQLSFISPASFFVLFDIHFTSVSTGNSYYTVIMVCAQWHFCFIPLHRSMFAFFVLLLTSEFFFSPSTAWALSGRQLSYS